MQWCDQIPLPDSYPSPSPPQASPVACVSFFFQISRRKLQECTFCCLPQFHTQMPLHNWLPLNFPSILKWYTKGRKENSFHSQVTASFQRINVFFPVQGLLFRLFVRPHNHFPFSVVDGKNPVIGDKGMQFIKFKRANPSFMSGGCGCESTSSVVVSSVAYPLRVTWFAIKNLLSASSSSFLDHSILKLNRISHVPLLNSCESLLLQKIMDFSFSPSVIWNGQREGHSHEHDT